MPAMHTDSVQNIADLMHNALSLDGLDMVGQNF